MTYNFKFTPDELNKFTHESIAYTGFKYLNDLTRAGSPIPRKINDVDLNHLKNWLSELGKSEFQIQQILSGFYSFYQIIAKRSRAYRNLLNYQQKQAQIKENIKRYDNIEELDNEIEVYELDDSELEVWPEELTI